MKIIHTIAGMVRGTGGPSTSVPGLCSALARRGHEVVLLTGSGDLAESVHRMDSRVRVVTVSMSTYWTGNFSSSFGAACKRLAHGADVLHTHGLWLHPNIVTSAVGASVGLPVVVSPRGMLSPWALRRGSVKKRLVWFLVQRRWLAQAAFLHASSSKEAGDFRAAGIRTPIATIANGIDPPIFDSSTSRWRNSGRTVLFLSRVHPVKGIDLLLAAWKLVAQKFSDARLVIAGPGEPRYVEQLKGNLERGLRRVEYIGPVGGEDKRRLIADASVLVLPSRSESYGMVVAEALAIGTPVVISTAVPWPEVETYRCGWRVELSLEAIAEALCEALGAPVSELAAMGRRGRSLIEDFHTTDIGAACMEAAYEWASGKRDRPEFVEGRRVRDRD